MPKLRLKVYLKTETEESFYETTGYYQKDQNKLTYREKDNTIVNYYYTDNILKRENNELTLKFEFKKDEQTTGIIQVKGLNRELNVLLKTIKMSITEQNINIIYSIEDQKFNYKIEVI